MKKIIWVISILCSLSCSKSDVPENDLQKMHLKGEVIAILDEDSLFYFFNKKGNIEKDIYPDSNGSTSSFTTYFYVNNKLNKKEDHLILTSVYNGETFEKDGKELFYYDQSGKLVSSTWTSIMPKLDLKHKEEFYYFYDKNQRLIKNVSKFHSGQSVNESHFFYFYTDDLLDSIVKKSPDKSKLFVEIFKNNLLIKFLGYDSKGNLRKDISTTNYSYKFDAIGNWIERSFFKAGKRVFETREIFYKDDDINNFSKMYDRIKMKYESGLNESKKSHPNIKMNESPKSSNLIISTNNSLQNLQSESQPQKQWVNCKYCNGTGKNVCYHCNGDKQITCGVCSRGLYLGRACGSCGGKGYNICGKCNGKGSDRNCSSCDGRGQVLVNIN